MEKGNKEKVVLWKSNLQAYIDCATLDLSAFPNSDKIKLDGSKSYDSIIERGQCLISLNGIVQKKRKM